ncbi:MAG: hemerythrin family protein [FCB group bacterium]|nr:hemerythrin family protein [FCB group bacterium]
MTGSTHNINWLPQLETGVKVIDEQHRHLADLINTYGEDLELGHVYKRMMIVFSQIIESFTFHFKTEEDLMKGNRFPGYDWHRNVHVNFMERLVLYIDKFKTGDKLLGLEAHRFLRDWLYNHIMDHTSFADKQLGKFLNDQGIY